MPCLQASPCSGSRGPEYLYGEDIADPELQDGEGYEPIYNEGDTPVSTTAGGYACLRGQAERWDRSTVILSSQTLVGTRPLGTSYTSTAACK